MNRVSEFEKGMTALKKGDYEIALQKFKLLAEQGEAEAQFNLGEMYSFGQGVPEDYKKAAQWVRLAAVQGHARAQFALGIMYAEGEGVPKDYIRAYM